MIYKIKNSRSKSKDMHSSRQLTLTVGQLWMITRSRYFCHEYNNCKLKSDLKHLRCYQKLVF